MFKTSVLTVAAAAMTLSVSANANLITIVDATASNGGDQYGPGVPGIYDGSGIDKSVDANDPSTWTFDGNGYQSELMSWFLPTDDGGNPANPTPPANNKLAWLAVDLGSSQALGTLYLFNTNYQGGLSGVNAINIYTADSPTVALPSTPNKNQFATTGLVPEGDYDFSSGGWTQFGSTTNVAKAGVGTFDLSGINARFIAIETLSNHGDTYNGGRTGIEEIAITAVPEPGSLALLGLGGLLIGSRRRRG